MIGIGSLIGGALSAAGSIYGGIKASKAAKDAQEKIDDLRIQNKAWYDLESNRDFTQRGDAQRLIKMTNDSIRDRNRAAAGTQAVMGGTDASVAAAKEANNKALADAVGNISAQAADYQDKVRTDYANRDMALAQQQANADMQKANAISQAIQGVTSAGGNIGTATDKALDEYGYDWIKIGKGKKTENDEATPTV